MQVLFADRALAGAELNRIDHAAVLVADDGTVTWVGREAELSADQYPADATLRRLGDVTLLPGLIDAHVHLAFDGGPTPVKRMMAESDAAQVALMLRSARELLSVGVTTARDLGARGYLDVPVREAIANGTARGPRMVTAGSPITVTGGHCWFMGGEADSIEDVRRMVRTHHKMGVDVIKVMSTGGNMTAGSAPWHAQFETESLRVIVAEAHRVGKKVAAHAHGAEGIERALTAGVDTLEHCSFQKEGGGFELIPELADRIAAADVYVSPTMNFRLPEMAAMMPERDFAVSELYKRGAKIIASTDSGIDNVVHHGFIGCLTTLHDFGLPIAEVLTATTTRAARALGLEEVTGQLTPGYAADLIAVGGDPTTDLEVLRDLRLVMTNGVDFTPDALPPIAPLPPDFLPMSMRRRPDPKAEPKPVDLGGAPRAEELVEAVH